MHSSNAARALPTQVPLRNAPRPAPPSIGAIDMIGYAPTLPVGLLNGGTGQLPSSESVNAVLAGEANGWLKVAMSTALRAILISPGMAVAGARGWSLVSSSLLSSATITTFLFIFYSAHNRS